MAFARDPVNGLINHGWPTYNPAASTLAQLGNIGNETGVVFTTGTMFDGGCTATEAALSLTEEVLGLFGGAL